ncbi:hypothetical protein C8J57DRAFT_1417655 [Mycena rebaudengoi]|nr:hypothetical protein C8J57DRAFT_1417655 [Mycena rebaudengoi]
MEQLHCPDFCLLAALGDLSPHGRVVTYPQASDSGRLPFFVRRAYFCCLLDLDFDFQQTCKVLRTLSDCRPFWVYVNMDIDRIQRRPGRKRRDYTLMSTPSLRSHALAARDIYQAWGTKDLVPKQIYTIPLHDASQIIAVPWTRVLLYLGNNDIWVQDWGSGVSNKLSIQRADGVSIISMHLFWVGRMGCNVLVVRLADRHAIHTSSYSELQLFSIREEAVSGSHLSTVVLPYAVSSLTMVEDHLAVVGYTFVPLAHVLHSLKVSFTPHGPTTTVALVQISPKVRFI